MERLTKNNKLFIDCDGCYDERANCGYCETITKAIQKLAEYEDLEEQGLLLRLPCKVGDAVDKLFSHNEVVALWYDKPSDKDHSYLLWRGMAHQIPKEYKENRILKFKGIIPERFSESDTINLLITPYVIPCEEAEAKLRELEGSEEE